MLKKDNVPQYDPSITPDNLTSLYQKRFLQMQKDHPDILKLTPDEIKHVFHAIVVLCEINLHTYLLEKQKSGHFEMPTSWSEYFYSLRALQRDMLRSETEDIRKILENLTASLIFSNKSLMMFFEQDAVKSAYAALVPAVINSGYLFAASNSLFDMEHYYSRFSWVDPNILQNPWFLAYRRFFISADESQLFSAIQLDNQYPNAVVKLKLDAVEPI